ncbi:MAG: efflux RND transporter periplasmic adaptor subunit [Verrucomicrobia bacterium]|nr:efflux RND transporter periplasmic adaptor subunit [Verrucomicrobiota bacterium]MCF7708309.1 efflux RND transporter periplasmic adaptor subunit [Verrucomicrobiota bacterium]
MSLAKSSLFSLARSKTLRWLIAIGLVALIIFKIRTAPVSVDSYEVERGTVVAEVMGTGTLEAKVSATISSRIQEKIDEIPVDQNDYVEEGRLLVRLDDEELKRRVAVAEATLEAAEASVERVRADEARANAVAEEARSNYDRISELYEKDAASKAELDKALEQMRVAEAGLQSVKAATAEAERRVITAEKNLLLQKEQLSRTKITSPFGGLIIRRDLDPGDTVVPGGSILQLISTNVIWVSAWVDETVMDEVSPGQTARIVFRSLPDMDFKGEVSRLGREVDRETREFLVDVQARELPGNWAIGQRAEVFIQTGRRDSVLYLPYEFIHWRDGTPGVFMSVDGKARWREITLGAHGEEEVEVRSGVDDGALVIKVSSADNKALVDGQRVDIR